MRVPCPCPSLFWRDRAGAVIGKTSSFGGINVANTFNSRLQPLQMYVTTATISGTTLTQLQSMPCPTVSASIMGRSYNFSAGSDNGNVQSITNCLTTTRSQNFLYDPLNRIWQAYTSGPNWGETYSSTAYAAGTPFSSAYAGIIDAWGNLTKRSGVTGKTNTDSLNLTALTNNQLSGSNYDAAGNMTSNSPASYQYDAENRLISTASYTYTYDGDGSRVEKSSGSTGTLYWRGPGGDPISESSLTGTSQEEYIFFGGTRVARRDVTGSVVHYYFSDHLGSHAMVENATGSACEQDIDYYPYGGVEEDYCSNGPTQHYKFTGKERDSESGLDNFGARYDASSMGRFMTPDPLMASAHASNPQTWNRYAYALNNPLRYVDPDGMAACTDKDKCVEVTVNVIYDQNANKGKGLTDQQKGDIQKQILAKAQDQFGTSKIKLDLSFTAGKISVDSQGNASFSGLQKGALNLLFTSGAPYSATQGDAGATSKASGNYLSVIDVANTEFDVKETVPHELAHQFLGDPDRTPNKDALIDAGFHIYREADIGVRNFFQRQGVSQTDYQQGARKFSPPQTQENITPKQ